MLRKRGVTSLIYDNNRHPQDGDAEEYLQNALRKRTITSEHITPILKPSQPSYFEPLEDDDKQELRDAKTVYSWTDWVASIFGDLTDICFALQPFIHLTALVIFPYVGLLPVMLGFTVKWFFALFQMTKEFDDNNKEEGGYLMRRMVLFLAPPIILLSFITVVAVLSKAVMMITIGVSIAVEIAYLMCNVYSSVGRFLAARKEVQPAENAFYASLNQEQCNFLHRHPDQLKQLVAASFAHYDRPHFRGILSDKEQLRMYEMLCDPTKGEHQPSHAANAIRLSPEQLRLYADVTNADRKRRKRRRDIVDRSHILIYSILQLAGAVMSGVAPIMCPPLLIPGSALLAVFGTWALFDKLNYHPFKWVMNKLFDNVLKEEQHGKFELSTEKLPLAVMEREEAIPAPVPAPEPASEPTPSDPLSMELTAIHTRLETDVKVSTSHHSLYGIPANIRRSLPTCTETNLERNLSLNLSNG